MAENQPQPKTRVLNTVTMGSSGWSVATYGIVEFLRVHPFWRAVTALLGVATGLALVATYVGLKIPEYRSATFLSSLRHGFCG
jgi:hypothetical protein